METALIKQEELNPAVIFGDISEIDVILDRRDLIWAQTTNGRRVSWSGRQYVQATSVRSYSAYHDNPVSFVSVFYKPLLPVQVCGIVVLGSS